MKLSRHMFQDCQLEDLATTDIQKFKMELWINQPENYENNSQVAGNWKIPSYDRMVKKLRAITVAMMKSLSTVMTC